MRQFYRVWLSQLCSVTGTVITAFTLVFWLYESTRSVTILALSYLFLTVPSLLLLPLAGGIARRLGPRRALLLGDLGALLALALVGVPLWLGGLSFWHVYALILVRTLCVSLQWPAFSAARQALVPPEHQETAGTLMALVEGLPEIVAPLLVGLLYAWLGVAGLVSINAVAYLLSLLLLLSVYIPAAGAAPAASEERPLGDLRAGLRYVRSQPGLLGLLLFFAATNFTLTFVQILITPLSLTVAPVAWVGPLLAFAGMGMLVGMLLFGRWGGPRQRVQAVLGLTLVQGLLLLLGGLRPSLWLIALAAFAFMVCFPAIMGSSQAIWDRKVPVAMRERAAAVRRMLAWSTIPLAQISAGPLCDLLFEPLMAPGGGLAASLGPLLGVGPGRGIGLLFMLLGLLTILAVAAGYAYPRLRRIEEEMPDIVEQDPASDARLSVMNAF